VELAKEFDVSRSYLDRMLNERTALTTAVKRKLEAYLSN
jgi:plasmid maintenance system antidote protein VapI